MGEYQDAVKHETWLDERYYPPALEREVERMMAEIDEYITAHIAFERWCEEHDTPRS